MGPDEFDDDQLLRMVALGMAVVWTHRDDVVSNVGAIAECFVKYIKTGDISDA